MKTVQIAALLIAAASFALPVAARADETTSFANVLAAEQLADIAQTMHGLTTNRCYSFLDPAYPERVAAIKCVPEISEGDPLARPFVHSYATEILAAATINVGFRMLGKHVPVARYALAGVVVLYPLLLIHNAHQMHVAATLKL